MKKKICFIVSTPYTFQFIQNHMKSLSNDYTIYLVANIDDKNKEVLNNFKHDFHKSISIERNIHITKDFFAIYNLYKYFRHEKFDSIHSITPKAGLISAIAGRLARIKNRIHIFTGQVWATKEGLFKYLLKILDKIIVSFSTHILVDGNSQKDFLISEGILNKNQGQVLGFGSISGVDLVRFSPNINKRVEIRKNLGLFEDITVFLFLGRLNVDKGIIELAKAFDKLNVENKKTFLLLVGFDEDLMMTKINDIVADKHSFQFINTTPTPEIYYQASDVFCLPSYREGFGMSVIEASACKIPVICSDAYGLMDTIIDNKTGLRHNVKDVNGLYNQMKKLSQNSKLRNSLGERGYTYIHDNFSSEIITNEWVKFYNKILY